MSRTSDWVIDHMNEHPEQYPTSADHSGCARAVDYWERRCRAAEQCLSESPFPTKEDHDAWQAIKNSDDTQYFDPPKIEPGDDDSLPF